MEVPCILQCWLETSATWHATSLALFPLENGIPRGTLLTVFGVGYGGDKFFPCFLVWWKDYCSLEGRLGRRRTSSPALLPPTTEISSLNSPEPGQTTHSGWNNRNWKRGSRLLKWGVRQDTMCLVPRDQVHTLSSFYIPSFWSASC